jgi:hypothetical protein
MFAKVIKGGIIMTELLAAAVLLPLSFFAIKFRLEGLELLKTPICMELGWQSSSLPSYGITSSKLYQRNAATF